MITDPLGNTMGYFFGYDPASQDAQYFLTQGDGPWGDLSWTYERVGNRLSETRDGVVDTYSYVPNAAGGNSAQLQQIQFGAGGTKTYSHDPASVVVPATPKWGLGQAVDFLEELTRKKKTRGRQRLPQLGTQDVRFLKEALEGGQRFRAFCSVVDLLLWDHACPTTFGLYLGARSAELAFHTIHKSLRPGVLNLAYR